MLESTRGATLDTSWLGDRVAVVFYEARGHTHVNDALKRACARLLAPGRPLSVLGVADLAGLGFMKHVVRPAVRAVAERYGAELYLDFDGAMRRAPFGLEGGGSEVAILDADGRKVFHAAGRLDGDDVDRFFAALGAALDRAGVPIADRAA